MKSIEDFDFQTGEVLLFNKPKTWTSFAVVKKVRWLVKVKKVGHAGTLDPLASGLLILCTGRKTKTIDSIQGQEKEYEVTFRLGATTPSDDAEFEPENITDTSHITQEMVEASIDKFRGEIQQIPPQFSAVKIAGKRAYKSAREGKEVKLRPRIVTIHEFTLLDFASPESVSARIRCSKGTYIRSLVRDIGKDLNVGAYMTDLVRTRIGEYTLDNAWEIDEFADLLMKDRNQAHE